MELLLALSVQLKQPELPNFDTEINRVSELRAVEARKALEVPKVVIQPPNPVMPVKAAPMASGSVWDRLAMCESGGRWNINTGNGFYGGLQFDIQTWGNYGGFARADLAPREVQIAKATEVHARRGFSPWPSCKAKLGL